MVLIGQRIFLETIKKYCLARKIACEVRSGGWLVIMTRGGDRRLAIGYDVGLNSAVAHQVGNDKAACAEVLAAAGIPVVPHKLFLGAKLSVHIPGSDSLAAMAALLDAHPRGLVVKPNEGTSGELVIRVTTRAELEAAVAQVFAAYPSLAISPYVEIEDEVRVVLLDGRALIVYGKQRGQDWRHNLDTGAVPVLITEGAMRDACTALAVRAAETLRIRFASIDVVCSGDEWRVLEVNSGVKMEALGKRHPELVEAAYTAALDAVFAEDS